MTNPAKFLLIGAVILGGYFLLREDQYLVGGKGDELDEEDVDEDELMMGIEVEREHTTNKKIAKEIALDHLAEDPQYYTKLKLIHKENPEFYEEEE
jgi:hypothetical protein